MSKRILFTGGGSAGHVTVNLALIPKFREEGFGIDYIGSENGIEKQLVTPLEGVTYHSVSTGKLRRYFDWNNFIDPFRVLKGVFQAWNIIRKRKPSVIFSKGGFVSVPVVMAGKLAGVPVIIHESDLTPGLANKLAKPFASKILTTFPETVKHLDPAKAVHVGAIVREELFQGDAARGREYCGFDEQKPVLLVMGGSLGSRKINETVRANLDALTGKFQIVHLCGKGNVDPQADRPGYRQYEYIREELPDVLAMADMVVSRAGSNSIFEFLALRKPMLLIPLSRAASRGDQILNARSFKNQGLAEVLEEEQITAESFLEAVLSVYERREEFLANMQRHDSRDSLSTVIGLIKQSAGC